MRIQKTFGYAESENSLRQHIPQIWH